MIDEQEISDLMESTAVVVREYFSAERKKIATEMDAVELRILAGLADRLKDIPAGPEGKQGESIVGPPGPAGRDGESIVGPEGREGPPGRPGQDIDREFVRKLIEVEVGLAIVALPKPKDGESGKNGEDVDYDVIHDLIAAEVDRAVAALPKAKDGEPGPPGKPGESIHPDTIALMVVTEVAKAVALIPEAKPGRDATQIDYLPSVDPSKSYPRGTHALYEGGEIRATRNTSPLANGFDKSGWEVVKNGVAKVAVTQSEDLRSFSFKFRHTGGSEESFTFSSPVVLDRGIWRESEEYARGDGATWGGSFWICQVDATKAKPGISSDWRLSVKEGRSGKDGKGEKGDKGEPGKDGKDFRPMGGKW